MRSLQRLVVGCACGLVASLAGTASAQQSVARQWNEQLISAIRLDLPRPPVHARNLYHVSVCMYDAWAAYDANADQVLVHERATAADIEAARREAISYAAYRMIKHRYQNAFGSATTLARLNQKMAELGYNIAITTTIGDTPAALGNRIFTTVKNLALLDGANESGNYAQNIGYAPVNAPLIVDLPTITMVDPNRWQPLALSFFVTQNGIPIGTTVQTFVGPHWGRVTPFSLHSDVPTTVYIDPGPPPRLGTDTDAQFKEEFAQVIRYSALLTPVDSELIDISPGAHHNNPLGTNDGTGYPVNPATGMPYPPNVVKLGDYARVLAEFWADGPNSETPPGHWNVLANYVSDHAQVEKRYRGTGPIMDDLEWDVKLYLALNGAEHDTAIGCWGTKGYYDYVRPISAIRYMCSLGQCSDPMGASYHPLGVPLEPGLIEVITPESAAPGERHENLWQNIGEVAIRSWLGEPFDTENEIGGVDWIRAKLWMPYQRRTFVTPPFAAYTSGHSTYSRSGAEVLSEFTGNTYFPGGLGTFTAHAGEYLVFEDGPSEDVVLQWARYYDAADEAGISRLYGGIHIASDDFNGRIMGSTIGKKAFAKADRYFKGRITCPANWNGADGLDSQDFFDFLNDFFAGAADYNDADGTDSQDFFDFLNDFFDGCTP